jgi:hypothetical protein
VRFRRGRSGGPTRGPALYDFVRSHVDAEGRLQPAGSRLPDEPARDPSQLSWAPGALDGAFGHAGDDVDDEQRAARVADLVQRACRRPSARRRRVLYEQVREDAALEIADPLTQRLSAHLQDPQAVRELGCWLATTAPDRGAVKVGLVLLGVAGVGEALQVVRVLGAHEELTLYAAVAVGNGTDDPEAELWAMARKVEGWGRIHCVERLQHTTDPAIRDWILRTGFRNSVMDDYLALIAARTGGLLPALRGPDVDRELLTAAGEILQALLPGGPAGDIDDYEDGAEAVEAYLEVMRTRATDLADLAAVTALQQWLASDSWTEPPGWSAVQRELCLAACREITARDHWLDWISVALLSEDEAEFAQAQHLAVTRGQDTFDALLPRIWKDPFEGPWYAAWREADRPRAERLCAAARDLLPLDLIASGPADELLGGPDRRPHAALEWTLQALRDYSGVGGDLLLVGLQSPITRNRVMALKALQTWPRQAWPAGAQDLVQALSANDPHEQTREYAGRVLSGQDDRRP